MSVMRQARRGILGPLAEAMSSRAPAGPLPPGPRVNDWAAAGAIVDGPSQGVRDLLDDLWHPGPLHRAADGTPTRIPRRPVPSAGACYPVQTHVIDGTGARRVFDHERGVILRRDAEAEGASGWPASERGTAGTRLVFTVQPGRSFGRYRHRAWPLWIADAAYALAAVQFLLGAQTGQVELGPSDRLRGMLGVPRAADAEAWLALGLAPEIPLAAVEIADDPASLPARRAALAGRRSPSIEEFSARIGPAPRPDAERIARAAGQAWVRGASAISSWAVPVDAAPDAVAAALWESHLSAARLCYEVSLSGDAGARPVSGFPSTGDRWILHAVALLDTPGGPR